MMQSHRIFAFVAIAFGVLRTFVRVVIYIWRKHPTIFKCTVQWYCMHSQCYAVITTIHLHNSLHLIILKL